MIGREECRTRAFRGSPTTRRHRRSPRQAIAMGCLANIKSGQVWLLVLGPRPDPKRIMRRPRARPSGNRGGAIVNRRGRGWRVPPVLDGRRSVRSLFGWDWSRSRTSDGPARSLRCPRSSMRVQFWEIVDTFRSHSNHSDAIYRVSRLQQHRVTRLYPQASPLSGQRQSGPLLGSPSAVGVGPGDLHRFVTPCRRSPEIGPGREPEHEVDREGRGVAWIN